MPTEAEIQERMPTWDALSELFLDTELAPEDHQRIAAVLAASPYDMTELEAILRHEVYPACSLNLLCVAGAWGTWGEDWIRKNIAPRHNRRPKLDGPALLWSGIRDHWETVKRQLSERRAPEQTTLV